MRHTKRLGQGMNKRRYILTLSCKDTVGIVAAVSGFLAQYEGFIEESAQLGDPSTGNFFMRTVFLSGPNTPDYKGLQSAFGPIAARFKMNWDLHDTNRKPRVLLLVSKQDHCLHDLLHRYASGSLPIDIPAVVSNHQTVERMVAWYDIPFHHLPVMPESREKQESKIYDLMNSLQIDLIVLARYMQVLSPGLVSRMEGKAINIHHSFLPSFKGAKPYHQAFERGVKIIGATAHYVTNELDEGPIIEQEVIRVDHTHTPEKLLALGQDIEALVLSRAVQYHIEHRVLLNTHKTVVFK